MRGRTHKNMTRMLFPNVPVYAIDRIGARLDNANMMDKTISSVFGKQNTDFFGLTRQGHRKYNHDLASALLVANIIDNQYGSKVAIAHLMQDQLSNLMVDKYGVEGRDLLEAVFNFSIARSFSEKRKRKKMYHPPSFGY